ncbi:MAG TPA: MFS transporter, partial [Acidimicrobiales bacterium]|nr:MFS transporter [Acidimicrobiales bacterium]
MRKGPLADSYPAAVALVVSSLIPFLGLTAAVLPVLPHVGEALHLSPTTLDIALAMSTAAYAVGTVVAVQFAVHLPPRRMLVLYEALFVVASLLAATTHDGGVFVAAFIVQGLCTSLMLIAAVPPLVTAWPAKKMPLTGAIMNLCIFGAVAVGPTIGAEVGASSSWRVLFWGVAGVSVVAFAFSLLTYEDDPPADKSAPWDLNALTLAVVGSGAAFYGAGALQAFGMLDMKTLVPLVGGFVLVIALVVHQYRARDPLMPVRAFATTIPVVGITLALFASAAGFGLMELVLTALKTASTPGETALLFLPEFLGAAVVAGIFGALFAIRYVTVLAFSGMGCIIASAAIFLVWATSGSPMVAVGTGLLGIGVGASVSPALFMAGFSLRSNQLQRVFALIELLRGVTAFLV